MANSDYLIAGNDEHGLEPVPTAGKRTPYISRIGRSIYENEFNKEAKRYFLEACARNGFRTLDVKPGNEDLTLASRAQFVNYNKATLLITFAYNAASTYGVFSGASGVETFYSPTSSYAINSRILATKVQNNLIKGTKQSNRGVKTADYYMLRAVNCPSVIVEAGFMTNLKEAKLMIDPDFQEEVGEECCKAVCSYFSVPYKAKAKRNKMLLKIGNRGSNVKYLQSKLLSKLYAVGPIDGIFGKGTERAVKLFQKDNKLVTDGIVGAKTWNKLSNI